MKWLFRWLLPRPMTDHEWTTALIWAMILDDEPLRRRLGK